MINKLLKIVFLLGVFFLQAQEPVTVHLSEQNGLPDKEFYSVIEDNNGFIWLCADKGLFRYDGKNYNSYTNQKQKGASLFGVKQDALERIWCNNIAGQFFYVKGNRLELFLDLSKTLKGELADFIVVKNFLWVFTQRTIYKIHLETKKTEIAHQSRESVGSSFYFKDRLFFNYPNENKTANTIYNITENGGIIPLATIRLLKRSSFNQKSKIFSLENKLFYKQKISGINRFFKISLDNKNLKEIQGFSAIAKERIYSEFINNDELWLTTNSGVWVYQITDLKATLKKRFLKDKNVTQVIKDKDNNYWLTTLNNGVYILPNLFIEEVHLSLKNKNSTCLEKINNNTLFLGTDKGTIIQYDLKHHQGELINLPTKYRVSALKYHPYKNLLFISTDEKGFQYNLKTKQLKKLPEFTTVKSAEVLKNKDLAYIDYKKLVLVKKADFKKKIKLLDVGKRAYTTYYNNNNENIYVAFIDNLVVYDKDWNKKVVSYDNQPIYAKSITKTEDGVVWVATFNQGVLGLKNNKVIKQYNLKNVLQSNTVYKIKADKNNLWIVLDNAIQVLDVTTEKIKTLTKTDGVISYDISGIEFIKNKVYFSSNEGLFSIEKEKCFKKINPKLYFNQFTINEKDTLVTNNYQLKHHQNNIKIGFNVNGFTYNQKEKYKYRLKGLSNQWFTTDIGGNTVKYNSLPAGNYIFEAQAMQQEKLVNNSIQQLVFTIQQPFWKTWWFIASILFLIIGSIVLYYKQKIKKQEQERLKELEKIALEKEVIALNLTALRSQMNPHFIFNALNSIQDLILKEDTEASYDYIVLFSELIRNTLNYSNQDFIPLEEEIKFLEVYLQLEKLRFGKDFSYSIKTETEEGVYIPSLLIQPFIENALVHGLMHKKGNKVLNIVFRFKEQVLECQVTDNGIGREKTKEIATRQGNHHKSFALGAIEKRLSIFKKQYADAVGYKIIDLYENKKATGTQVIVKIPFEKKF